MKELVKEILAQIGFSEKYIEICNSYKEYDRGMSFTKKQVEGVLYSYSIDFDYASKDKSFYKDYIFGSYKVKMTMTYKYGFVECFYSFWNTENDDYVIGRFNSIALLEDEGFKERVTHSFPVATSLEDLESILRKIIELHCELIKHFEKKLQNI